MLKYAILGFLNYSPMTGYEIKQRMDRSTTHFWHAKLSQIYTTLKDLEKEGCITSMLEEQSDRPDKRIYSVTENGQAQFFGWLKEPYWECSPKKETFVLKMFFAAKMSSEQMKMQLQIQLDMHKKQLDYYRHQVRESIDQAKEEFPELKKDAMMWEASRRFGEMYEEVYVKWIEELLAGAYWSTGE